MNWLCTGTNWQHAYSGPDPAKYGGVDHDKICKDIGTTIFEERFWEGDVVEKPFGETRRESA